MVLTTAKSTTRSNGLWTKAIIVMVTMTFFHGVDVLGFTRVMTFDIRINVTELNFLQPAFYNRHTKLFARKTKADLDSIRQRMRVGRILYESDFRKAVESQPKEEELLIKKYDKEDYQTPPSLTFSSINKDQTIDEFYSAKGSSPVESFQTPPTFSDTPVNVNKNKSMVFLVTVDVSREMAIEEKIFTGCTDNKKDDEKINVAQHVESITPASSTNAQEQVNEVNQVDPEVKIGFYRSFPNPTNQFLAQLKKVAKSKCY